MTQRQLIYNYILYWILNEQIIRKGITLQAESDPLWSLRETRGSRREQVSGSKPTELTAISGQPKRWCGRMATTLCSGSRRCGFESHLSLVSGWWAGNMPVCGLFYHASMPTGWRGGGGGSECNPAWVVLSLFFSLLSFPLDLPPVLLWYLVLSDWCVRVAKQTV